MKQDKFSKLENNYYYGISRVFWHIIIGLGSLAIIGGIVVLVWSQIPASQDKVVRVNQPVKKSYPKATGVSLGELMKTLPKGAELTKIKNDITLVTEVKNTIIEKVEEDNKRDTVGLSKLNKQIDILKKIIPFNENKILWEGQGYYTFNSSRDKKMFKKNNIKYSHLRHWISTSKSIDREFIKITDNRNLKSNVGKAALLASYNDLLKNVNKEKRASLLKNYLIPFYTSKKGLGKSVNIIETISKIIKLIDSKEQIEGFRVLVQFSRYNPNDGLGLQEFQQSILQKFELNQRLNIIKTINNEYSNNYDFQLTSIIDNTKQFMPMLPGFKGDQQPVALKNFYRLFKNKNKNRDQQIQQIDDEFASEIREIDKIYKNELQQAKADLLLKQDKKIEMKLMSYKSIAYGLGVVLLISLILLVLSMIRNVNRLAEAMLQNNNKIS